MGEIARRFELLRRDGGGVLDFREESISKMTQTSRREMLAGGAALLGLLSPSLPTTLADSPPNKDDFSEKARRVVDRITFGATQDEYDLYDELGHAAYIEHHLNHTAIDDSDLNTRLASFKSLNDTPRDSYIRVYVNGDYTGLEEMVQGTILRAIYSKRQLFERTVEMWSDHFTIYMYKDTVLPFKPIDDRDVIRKGAFGMFRDLVMASAKSPAMLSYLDNIYSYVGHPNQNYARELCELHTLAPGNYTQKDIEEIARALTGWSYVYDLDSNDLGKFYFYAQNHDNGQKKVLGRLISSGGVREGETIVRILTTFSPQKEQTAQFVGWKMARQFYGLEDNQEVVDAVAAAYLSKTGGDIKAMLRACLREDFMVSAPPKFKRPFHYMVGTLRQLGADIDGTDKDALYFMQYMLQLSGHHPFYWITPDGYPDEKEYWTGYLTPRWQWASYLQYVASYYGVDYALFQAEYWKKNTVAWVNKTLFFGNMTREDKAALDEYLSSDPTNFERVKETIGLALSAPSYNWY